MNPIQIVMWLVANVPAIVKLIEALVAIFKTLPMPHPQAA